MSDRTGGNNRPGLVRAWLAPWGQGGRFSGGPSCPEVIASRNQAGIAGMRTEKSPRKRRATSAQCVVIGSSSSVMFLLFGHGIVSEKNSTVTLKVRTAGARASSAKRGLRGTMQNSELPAQFAFVVGAESNSKFQFPRFAAHHRAPRFISSFKMIDSAISFMDLRICWLWRCSAR